MASRSLGTLTIDMIAKTGGFTQGMSRAERAADKSSRAIEARMRKLGKAIDASLAVAAAAATAAFAAITVGVSNALQRMDALSKTSQKIGIATDSLSKLAYAAQLSDVSFEALEGSLSRLAKSQDAAAQGSKQQLEIFRALGVEFQRQDGTLRSTEAVLNDVADAIARLPDGANKTAAAMALFGKSGAQLIPLLNGGSDSIRAAGDELERLGGVVTPEAAKQAEQFNDDVTRLKTALDGLWISLATDLLPDMVKFTEELVDATKNGAGLRTVMDGLKEGIRGVAMVAQIAVDTVQGLTLKLVGLYNIAQGIARLNIYSQAFTDDSAMQSFRNAGLAFDLAGEAQAESRALLGGTPALPDSRFSLPGGRKGRAAATRDEATEAIRSEEAERALAEALKAQREEAEKAAGARAAKAEADREAAKAAREAAQAEKDHADAQQQLTDLLREQTEQQAGPQLQAALAYQAEMVKILALEEEYIRLGKLDADTTNLIALARQNASNAYAKQTEEIAKQLTPLEQLLEDLQFESDLMGMTNAQRITELELRRLGVDMSAEEVAAARARIQAKVEELEAERELISEMDRFRSSFEDNVAGVIDGSKSIKEAIRDLVADFLAQMARMAAQNLTQSLFGQQGTTGGGGWGDAVASFFSWFGGGKASGGPIYPGKAYLVGEEGPELIRPMGAATVVPAGETRKQMAGGGGVTNITFVLPGRNDIRTESQRQAELARSTRKQLARSTA